MHISLNWELIIAIIALTVAIISPIITTAITCWHQRKLKRMELNHQVHSDYHGNRQKTFHAFIDAGGEGIHQELLDLDNLDQCEKCLHRLYLYVPSSDWPLLEGFAIALREEKHGKIRQSYDKVVVKLGEILQSSQKELQV